jgi:hypothetical protein
MVAAVAEAKGEGFGATSSQMIADRRERFAREATEWVSENEGAWSYMVKTAQGYASQGRKFGMQELAEKVRRCEFTDSHGRTTKVNNNHVAALARSAHGGGARVPYAHRAPHTRLRRPHGLRSRL